jgi:hypothetical protein
LRDPKKQYVIGKKPTVAERTLTERSFCEIDQYYYSEMFTCPICYGRDTENERIVKALSEQSKCKLDGGHNTEGFCFCEATKLIKGE